MFTTIIGAFAQSNSHWRDSTSLHFVHKQSLCASNQETQWVCGVCVYIVLNSSAKLLATLTLNNRIVYMLI